MLIGNGTVTILCITAMTFGIVNNLMHKKISKKESNYLLTILTVYLFAMVCLLLLGDFMYIGFIGTQIIMVTFAFMWMLTGGIKRTFSLALHTLSNIVLVICAISIVFYIFGTLLNYIPPTENYGVLGWGSTYYRGFFHVYYDGQTTDFLGLTLVRNIGIFNEAPMFAYVIVLSTYYEMFLGKFSKGKIAILIAATITTLSTTAITFMSVFIVIMLRDRLKNKRVIWFFIMPAVVLTAIVVAVSVLHSKLMTGNFSGMTRTDDFYAALKSFMQHPIVGNGYNNTRALDMFRTGLRAKLRWDEKGSGLSTGVGGILSNGGLLWGTFYLLPVILAVKNLLIQIKISGKNPYSENIRLNFFIIVTFILLVVTIVHNVAIGPFINVMNWSILFYSGDFRKRRAYPYRLHLNRFDVS